MVILEQMVMIMIRHALFIVDKNCKGLNLLIKLSNTEFFWVDFYTTVLSEKWELLW